MNKVVRRVLVISASVIGAVAIAAGGYIGYVILSYNRIGNTVLDIDHNTDQSQVKVGETYKALSYNIGFGAYSQDYTFFLDAGYDEEGKPTCGYYSKAKSQADVEFNTSGAIEVVKQASPDFVLFQEVDTHSTRSYYINQDEAIRKAFPSYDHTLAVNFHSSFLPYPFYDMHGLVNSGLTTLSRFQITEAQRKEYTVSDSLSKLFDLDRCFSTQKIKVDNGKNLYIINSHMSAYDEGGTIRTKQVAELNAFLQDVQDHGDYVVVGGDWNHDLLTYNPNFENEDGSFKYTKEHAAFDEKKKTPDWVNYYFDSTGKSPLIDGYKVVASDNIPSCRNNDIEWTPGKSYVCCVDGFIVSDNIEVVSHENIQTKQGKKGIDGFAYSDHEPVSFSFKLK